MLYLFICGTQNQGKITESALILGRKKKAPRTKQTNTGKLINLNLFKFKHMFLKMSVDLKTALSAEIHPARQQ